MKSYLYALAACFGLAQFAHGAVNADDLLPPEQAFVPTVTVSDKGVDVQFKIADGYYMYQSKITADTQPEKLLREPATFSQGEQKEDEFFGKQIVYHHAANVKWDYAKPALAAYKITLHYQGCAEAGVCYPPVDTELNINGSGVYAPENMAADNAKDMFVKPQGDIQAAAASMPAMAQNAPLSTDNADSRFALSRDTIGSNLLWFFVFGLGLSFTACMYPLLPIVSSIIVGDKSSSKKRAFALSFVYVQGLALTYTLVGVLAGVTGALLTVWLQQAWVVLAAAGLMVLLALSMFGLFNIQLPSGLQSYFQNQSNKLSGGKVASVFVMGMLSALIVGPCVAPPLAFALGYIGKTGDALLGGAALYAMAMGTGVPLILIGTFGGHILPRAGDWMNGIKFGNTVFAVSIGGGALYRTLGCACVVFVLLRQQVFRQPEKGCAGAGRGVVGDGRVVWRAKCARAIYADARIFNLASAFARRGAWLENRQCCRDGTSDSGCLCCRSESTRVAGFLCRLVRFVQRNGSENV